MTESEKRQSVVRVMRGWIGRKESDGSHKAIIDIYNNHKPLAQNYKVIHVKPDSITLNHNPSFITMGNDLSLACNYAIYVKSAWGIFYAVVWACNCPQNRRASRSQNLYRSQSAVFSQ